jgi:hypothetical protein
MNERFRITLLLVLLTLVTGLLTWVTASGTKPRVTRGVKAAFDAPPAWPGRPWTRDGHAVPSAELAAAAGPEHCGWQSVTMLTLGWPPGTAAETAAHARQYVRDPTRTLPASDLSEHLDLDAALPPDAIDTGYRYGPVALYVGRRDADEAVYLVAGRDIERWPRSDPMTVCS